MGLLYIINIILDYKLISFIIQSSYADMELTIRLEITSPFTKLSYGVSKFTIIRKFGFKPANAILILFHFF